MLKQLVIYYLCVSLVLPPQLVFAWGPHTPAPNKSQSISEVTPQTQMAGEVTPETHRASEKETPRSLAPDRRKLLHTFHLGFWRMSKILRKIIPNILKLRIDDYYTYFEAYSRCGYPTFKNTAADRELPPDFKMELKEKELFPTLLKIIDEQLLLPVQEGFVLYFENAIRVSELEQSAFDPIVTWMTQAELEPVVAPNNVYCSPHVSKPLLFNFGENLDARPENVHRQLLPLQQGLRELTTPMFLSLSARGREKLSHLEVRQWLTWLTTLREYRNLLARYYLSRDRTASVTGAPTLKVSRRVGEKLAEITRGMRLEAHQMVTQAVQGAVAPQEGREKLSVEKIAKQLLTGTRYAELLPAFTPCGHGSREAPENRYCYVDPEKPVNVDEQVIFSLQDPTALTPGHFLEAMRTLSKEALTTSLVYLRPHLEDHPWMDLDSEIRKKMTLPAACVPSSSTIPGFLTKREEPNPDRKGEGGEDERANFEHYIKILETDNRAYWIKVFQEGVSSLVRSYVEGAKEPPLPKEASDFYGTGQSLSESVIQKYFEQVVTLPSKVNEIKPHTSLEKRKEKILEVMEGFSFEESLKSGDSLFALSLGTQLLQWSQLVQEELLGLKESWSRKEEIVLEMVKQIVSVVLLEIPRGYLAAIVSGELMDNKKLEEIWSALRDQWKAFLFSEKFSKELDRIARVIAEDLFSYPGFQKPMEPAIAVKKNADEELTRYVRSIQDKLEPAVKAWDTDRYLENLIRQRKWGGIFPVLRTHPLFPNYYFQKFREEYKAGFNPDVGACFQVPDGEGHERSSSDPIDYPDPLHPREYEDHYLHLIGVLAEKHLDEITEKLKNLGYSEERVKKEFFPWTTTKQLAVKLVRYFKEIARTSDAWDRGSTSENKLKAFEAVTQWLGSRDAPKEYYQEAGEFARRLHLTYLKPLFIHRPDRSSAAYEHWRKELQSNVELLLADEIILPHSVNVDEVIKLFDQSEVVIRQNNEYVGLGPLKDRLAAISKEVVQKQKLLDEDGKVWEKFCLGNKEKCLLWARQVFAPLGDKAKLHALYRWRVITHSEDALTKFLDKLFPVSKPDQKQGSDPLRSAKNQILRALLGNPPRDFLKEDKQAMDTWALVGANIDGWLKEIKRIWEEKGKQRFPIRSEDRREYITSLRSEIILKGEEIYPVWESNLSKRVEQINSAIEAQTQEGLLAVFLTLDAVLDKEYGLLQGAPLKEAPGEIYQRELVKIVIPGFSIFHDQMLSKIDQITRIQMNPALEIMSRTDTRRKLRMELENLREGLEKSSAKNDAEYKRISGLISHEDLMIDAARRRQVVAIQVDRILSNYLPNLAGCKECLGKLTGISASVAGAKERKKEGKKSFEPNSDSLSREMAKAYLSDQILDSKTDVEGQSVTLTFRQMKEDLDRIASAAWGRLRITNAVAKRFLTEVESYCQAARFEPGLKASVEGSYRDTIESELKSAELEKVLPLSDKTGGSKLFEVTHVLSRLERLRSIRVWGEQKHVPLFVRIHKYLEGLHNKESGKSPDPFLVWVNERLFPKLGSGQLSSLWGHPEGLPTGAEICVYLENFAGKLKEDIGEKSGSDVPFEVATRYWRFVELVTDTLWNPHSRFKPLVKIDGGVVWVSMAPSDELPLAGEFLSGTFQAMENLKKQAELGNDEANGEARETEPDQGETPAAGKEDARETEPVQAGGDDRKIAETLSAFLSLPGLTRDTLNSILPSHSMRLPVVEWQSHSDRTLWLNSLSIEERRTAYESIGRYMRDLMRHKSTEDEAFGIFKKETVSELDYESWHKTLRTYLRLWHMLKSEIDVSSPMEDDLRFERITSALAELIVLHHDYAYDEKLGLRSLEKGERIDRKANFDLFLRASNNKKAGMMEKIRLLYRSEEVEHEIRFTRAAFERARIVEALDLRLGPLVFESPKPRPLARSFDFNKSLSGEKRARSDLSGAFLFYADHFTSDSIDVSYIHGLKWIALCRARRKQGVSCEMREATTFLPDKPLEEYFLPHGLRSDFGGLFEQWWSYLKDNPLAQGEFQRLKKLKKSYDREHLWDLSPNLEAMGNQPFLAQFRATLALLDRHSGSLSDTGHYGDLLRRLNWKMNHYGRSMEIEFGPGRGPSVISERKLGSLLRVVVVAVGFDLKDPDRLQALIHKKIKDEKLDLEDIKFFTLSIVKSKVGLEKDRFLSGMKEVPKIGEGSVFDGRVWREFPIVDVEERYQYCAREEFPRWFAKTENPEVIQLYRIFGQDEDEWPLYREQQAIRLKMMGERNLQNWENGKSLFVTDPYPADLIRRESRSSLWPPKIHVEKYDYQFGNVGVDRTRADHILGLAVELGIITEQEIEHHRIEKLRWVTDLIRYREMNSDFRDWISHMYRRYPREEENRSDEDAAFAIKTLERALTRLREQLQMPDAPLPDFEDLQEAGLSNGQAYRLQLAKAMRWAGELMRRAVFGNRTEEERERIRKLNIVIDQFYTEEAQKRSVKDQLVHVATKIHVQLEKLCKADFSDVVDEKKFLEKSELLRETKIVFYDQLRDFLFERTGWIPDASKEDAIAIPEEAAQSLGGHGIAGADKESIADETRRNLDNLQFKYETTHDILMKRVQFFSQIAMLAVAAGWLMGRGNPSIGKAVTSSRAAQIPMVLFVMLFGSAIAWSSADQIIETYWREPGRISDLEGAAWGQSPFDTVAPLMKDESAAQLEIRSRANYDDQHSFFPWVMHLISFNIAYQAIVKPLTLVARGGILGLMQRNRPWMFQSERFTRHARTLGLSLKDPVAELELMGLSGEAKKRISQAFLQELRASKSADGTLRIPKEKADMLRSHVQKEFQELCRESGRDPFTGKPFEYDGIAQWVQQNPLYGHYEKYLKTSRGLTEHRLELLKEWMRKLDNGHPLSEDELMWLVAGKFDPAMLHTPTAWRFLVGLPYTNPTISSLRRLRALTQAQIDILATHDPHTLLMLATVYQNNPGMMAALSRSDLFNPYKMRELKADMPADVRDFCERVLNRALQLGRDHAQLVREELGDAWLVGRHVEMDRRVQRAVFDWVMNGETDFITLPQAEDIVRSFHPEAERLFASYATFRGYVHRFLMEKGLALAPQAEESLEVARRLGAWFTKAMPAIRTYAARMKCDPEDVIHWMLSPDAPNHGVFIRKLVKPEFNPEAVGPGGTEVIKIRMDDTQTKLIRYAERLQNILRDGTWAPDVNFLKMFAEEDLAGIVSRITWKTASNGEELPPAGRSFPPAGKDPSHDGKRPPSGRPRAGGGTRAGVSGESPQGAPQKPFIVRSDGISLLRDDILPAHLRERLSAISQSNESFRELARAAVNLGNTDQKRFIASLLKEIRITGKSSEGLTATSFDLERVLANIEIQYAGDPDIGLVRWAYQAVSVSCRMMELSAGNMEIFRVMEQKFLSDGARVLAFMNERSVPWAKEVLDLPLNRSLGRVSIETAKNKALSHGVPEQLAGEAVKVLENTQVYSASSLDLDMLFSICRIPKTVAPHVKLEALDRVLLEYQNEPLVARMIRFMGPNQSPKLGESHVESARLLGSPTCAPTEFHEKIIADTKARIDVFKADLGGKISSRRFDSSLEMLGTRAARRLQAAESSIWENTRRIDAPKIPRIEPPDIDLYHDVQLGEWISEWKTGWVRRGIGSEAEAESLISEARGLGLGRFRLSVVTRVGSGEMLPKDPKAVWMEKLSGQIHAREIQATSEGVARNYQELLSARHAADLTREVYQSATGFTIRTPEEAEALIQTVYRRFGKVIPEKTFVSRGKLDDMERALIETFKTELETGKLPQELAEELSRSIDGVRSHVVEMVPLPDDPRRWVPTLRGILRPMQANMRSKMPLRGLMDERVLSNRRLVYHLLDGGHVIQNRWTTWRGDGSHGAGDLFIELFGPSSEMKVIHSLTEEQWIILRRELGEYYLAAKAQRDIVLEQALSRAIARVESRLGVSEPAVAPPPTPSPAAGTASDLEQGK